MKHYGKIIKSLPIGRQTYEAKLVILRDLAISHFHQGRFFEAETLLLEGLEAGKAKWGTRPADEVGLRVELARSLLYQDDDDAAIKNITKTSQISKDSLGPMHQKTLRCGDLLRRWRYEQEESRDN